MMRITALAASMSLFLAIPVFAGNGQSFQNNRNNMNMNMTTSMGGINMNASPGGINMIMVGLWFSSSSSICILEMTSTKLSGSSQIYR